MSKRVDFMQGIEAVGPGLLRAQRPLVQALTACTSFDIREIRVPNMPSPLVFPFIYGPLPAILRLRRADLIHIGNAWYAHVVPFLGRPTIVTCHDLIELDELESGERAYRRHRRFHAYAAFRGMLSARFIVCVSASTAARVVQRSPASAERVRVIHSGLSPAFTKRRPTELPSIYRVQRPYVLYVGSEQPRKNLVRLVAAIADVRKRVPDLHFIKVGSHQTPDGRAALLEALERERLAHHTIILEGVSDDELAALYHNASATVLPSLQEGFGFPALEAMACGCPAIVSNRGALREIVDGSALLVDPLDVRSLAQGIERVVLDRHFRESLVVRGLERAGRFTWEGAAQAYEALYEEALKGV